MNPYNSHTTHCQFAAADTSYLKYQIDQLVYQLYGLKDDEINIIENNLA